MTKKVVLNIGRKIEMLGAPTPTVEGEGGPQPMTVRDAILQRIPIVASRDTDHATRLWNIGLAIDKAKATFSMTELDFELLKKSLFAEEMQTWALVNLDRAFREAKRE